MSQESWTAVDEYVGGLLAPHDEALEAALRASEDAGLPAIQVSPAQGKLLYLLAKSIGARQIQLPQLDAEGAGPFDLTFIDADKVHTPDYYAWALDHSRPGSLIVSDNVVRFGRLADPDSDDPTIPAQRRLHEMLAADPRVEATTIQTVGVKGHDGFNVALVAG